MDEKLEMFCDNALWGKAIQHLIDKGVRPSELSQFTDAEFRTKLIMVIANGQYHVAPPHVTLIPKDKPGEFRKVYVNTVMDRLVLTLINEVYTTMYGYMFHEHCVSYRKGIGVKNIIGNITAELQKNSTGYKIDISKYFDSVSREKMNEVLAEVSTGSCLDQILYDYYNDDLIFDENRQLQRKYKSLCQGCAPSAFFANILLRDVDDALSKICEVYYRYSDDILLIGRRADEALALLKEMLASKGLSINPKKVERVSSSEWFTFLGCKIKGKNVSLSKKSLDNFIDQVERRLKGKAIKSINNYLYTAYMNNSEAFGWAEYFFGIINCEEDIIQLDIWLKDMIRGYMTGKGGRKYVGGLGSVDTEEYKTIMRGKGRCVKRNLEKTKGLLKEHGYVSMHHLYKCYRLNPALYRSEVYRLM